MPVDRKTERVVVVRTDANGNVLDYDVVEQGGQGEKLSSSRQTPRYKKNKTPNQELDGVRILKNEDSVLTGRSSSKRKRRRSERRTPRQHGDSTPLTPRRRRDSMPESHIRRRDSMTQTPGRSQNDTPHTPGRSQHETARTPRRRRVRYVPPKSNVQIFEEKVINWIADPKVDTKNEDAVRRLHMGVQKKIYREKLKWPIPKSTLDNHNDDLMERRKSGIKPVIYDSKLSWAANSRIDDHNDEYLEHKKRSAHLPNKIFSQSYQQEQRLKEKSLTESDYFNSDSSRLPPIDGDKRQRSRKPQIDQKNDEYIERLRQKRTEPKIFREKLKWRETHTPRIDNQNPEYLDAIRDNRLRPKIYSELPRWKSQSKIDTHNDMYDPNAYMKAPPIMREKLHWVARSRIDTGLEPESDEYDEDFDSYDDDDDYYEDDEYDYELTT